MNFSEVVTQKVEAPGSVENSGLVEVGLVRLVMDHYPYIFT